MKKIQKQKIINLKFKIHKLIQNKNNKLINYNQKIKYYKKQKIHQNNNQIKNWNLRKNYQTSQHYSIKNSEMYKDQLNNLNKIIIDIFHSKINNTLKVNDL